MLDLSQRKLIRQGDVLFIPVGGPNYLDRWTGANVSTWQRQNVTDVNDGIIQRGEATGHDHRLAEESLNAPDPSRRSFLKRVGGVGLFIVAGLTGAKVIQSGRPGEVEGKDLHHPVDLEPSTTYQAVVAREWDYGGNNFSNVRD